jgi:hypothetical protein
MSRDAETKGCGAAGWERITMWKSRAVTQMDRAKVS